jgi:hypothetical protein
MPSTLRAQNALPQGIHQSPPTRRGVRLNGGNTIPAFDTEMFVQESAMKPLDDAAGLGSGNLGSPMLDPLEL